MAPRVCASSNAATRTMLVAVEDIPVGCKRACTDLSSHSPSCLLLQSTATQDVLSREEQERAREGVHDQVLRTLRDRLALFDMQFRPISTGPDRHA